jgi:hypothetical protein
MLCSAGCRSYEWTNVTVTPLEPHPNDPATARGDIDREKLPDPA